MDHRARRDHLEIWLLDRGETRIGTSCDAKPVPRQLGVGVDGKGEVHARWLHGGKGDPPSVRRTDAGVGIELAAEFLGRGFPWERPCDPPSAGPSFRGHHERWFAATHACGDDASCWDVNLWGEWPLTVAFSDADDAAKGQQSLVATSQLRWGDPRTFGSLIVLPRGDLPGLAGAVRLR